MNDKCPKCGADKYPSYRGENRWQCGTYQTDTNGILMRHSQCFTRQLDQANAKIERLQAIADEDNWPKMADGVRFRAGDSVFFYDDSMGRIVGCRITYAGGNDVQLSYEGKSLLGTLPFSECYSTFTAAEAAKDGEE